MDHVCEKPYVGFFPVSNSTKHKNFFHFIVTVQTGIFLPDLKTSLQASLTPIFMSEFSPSELLRFINEFLQFRQFPYNAFQPIATDSLDCYNKDK